ncbi:MAG: hypothetical protein KGO51_06670 [Alphaproteobacteria bacterium]|nr:hypothetical protein [Alphaproteobacteria bacterium]
MIREKLEKLGSLFLAVFSLGLAVVMAADGLEGRQLFGSLIAVLASMTLAVTVRAWPRPAKVEVRD